MNERDERLGELLRAADAAREAPELGAGEAAWMRQRVLRAASEVPVRRRAARAWVLAGGAALLAIALGLVLTRTEPPGTPAAAPQRAAVQADTTPSERSSPARDAGNSQVATHPSAHTAVTPSPAPPRAANDAAPAIVSASRDDDDVRVAASRTGSRTRSPTRRRARPAVTVETAPRETVIAQARPERQPYQVQLTAPGGTRIVWVLTADNGR